MVRISIIAVNLLAFDLDLNSAVLNLYFDQVINASTLNRSAITLQSAVARRPMESLTLTSDSTTTPSPSGQYISLQLSVENTNEIKRNRNVCTSSQNCFLTVSQYLARSTLGASNNPISDGSAIVVGNFTEDVTQPLLFLWTLDMDTGIMELMFSETVNVTSFQFNQFTLQGISQMYTLTGGMLSPEPTDYVVVQLSTLDLNEIKRLSGIGTSLNDSYLSVGSSAITDMSGNDIVPIPSSNALMAFSFTVDTTRPELDSFSLNVASGVLILTFSEPVIGTSFNVSAITLFNGQISMVNGELQPTASYTLTGGSSSSSDSTVVEIHLTQQDLSAINSMDNLATSTNDTYIVAASTTVYDTSGNEMVPIILADRFLVSEYCSVSCSDTGKILVYAVHQPKL